MSLFNFEVKHEPSAFQMIKINRNYKVFQIADKHIPVVEIKPVGSNGIIDKMLDRNSFHDFRVFL